jgi:hypothetical protein
MLRGGELKFNKAMDLMRRPETRLVKTNRDNSHVYYVIPGGRVSDEVAKQIVSHPLVREGKDGMWPGLSQTWRIE